jgi:N-glycosylase/DNA lyase
MPAGNRTVRAELLSVHAGRKKEIQMRLRDFTLVPRHEYFYELAYCLLTPQSSAVNAGKVISLLKDRDFHNHPFDPIGILRNRNHYIRFHATKARRLLEMQEMFPAIDAKLSDGSTGEDIRAWLVVHVRGLGWKEASHFLRNIGHRDLAILDRHILRNLIRAGVLREVPRTLTPRHYLEIEKKFRRFCSRIGIPMDEMDLLFWSMETGMILK